MGKANMKKRRMIKRCAQMHKIQLFRRSIGADKDEVTAENIETATMKLHEKDKEAPPLVSVDDPADSETTEQTKTRENKRALQWMEKFGEKAAENIKKRVRKPGFRSEAGSTLKLKKGGDVEIGDISLEGDLDVEEGANVKVKGKLDLTTIDSEIEIDEKVVTNKKKKEKGVSRIEGNVELDGENAEVIVDEAELKGKIQIGKGAKLKVQPSTRDRCRKKKCPVKFGGPKENDEARKKAKAFLARSKEATNNADGGGRRRLSE